jgi:hypothetical protein
MESRADHVLETNCFGVSVVLLLPLSVLIAFTLILPSSAGILLYELVLSNAESQVLETWAALLRPCHLHLFKADGLHLIFHGPTNCKVNMHSYIHGYQYN